MVIYNKKTKYYIHLSESLDLGENEMNFEEINEEEINEAIVDIALKVFELDSNIDMAINDINTYYSKFDADTKLIEKIELLEEWKNSRKKEIFDTIRKNYINKLTYEVEASLKTRTEAYIKHINLMKSKEECLYKYEKLSNLIIQIPAKINYFLEKELVVIDNKEIKQQVKQNIIIKAENKKTSLNDEMSSCFGYEWEYLAV